MTDVKRLTAFAAVELRVDETGNQTTVITTKLEFCVSISKTNLVVTRYANSLAKGSTGVVV